MLAAHGVGRQRDRVGLVLDLDGQVQVLEDPVEERERALHLDLHVEQLARAGRTAATAAS